MGYVAAKRIAFLVDNYFEQVDFEVPIKYFKDLGANITVISSRSLKLQSMDKHNLAAKFDADLLLSDARSQDYDVLLIPGGLINCDNLRTISKAKAWATEFIDSGRLLASIGYAIWLLISADLVEARRITSPINIKDDVVNAGGEWVNMPVVVDESLITCQLQADIGMLNQSISEWLIDQPSNIKN